MAKPRTYGLTLLYRRSQWIKYMHVVFLMGIKSGRLHVRVEEEEYIGPVSRGAMDMKLAWLFS